MNKIIIAFFCWLLLTGCAHQNTSTSSAVSPAADSYFYKAVDPWFAAWELLSKEVYGIDKLRPVEFVFFDDKYVYSTSGISIPAGQPVEGPSLLNAKLVWKKELHNDSIVLPDSQKIPIALMSFASELSAANQSSFFVMPLPSFWEQAGVKSKELGDNNLITGVFLHEFAHSQQMQNFGKKMTEYEKTTQFGTDFTDDIVQHLFGKDSLYTQAYTQELNTFYNASLSSDLIPLARQAISMMRNRHAKYFTGKYAELPRIDEFFLTMEGLGQYSMYAWLIHPKGANLPIAQAIEGVRRNKKWWSQDEGFALFLVLEKLAQVNKWAGPLLADKTESVIDLISKEIGH